MSRLEEILNAGADYLGNASGKLREANTLVKNGKKVATYWNPLDDSQRQKAKREIERLKIKGRWLIIRYVVLWIVMIMTTRMIYLAI